MDATDPQLKFLHSESTLNGLKLAGFRRVSTADLMASLAPGQKGSLKVRPDGTTTECTFSLNEARMWTGSRER